VTYWIGRSYWGKGIATDALTAFLAVDQSRPLHARVASDNVASRRVLEKCGFRVIATERNVANARSAEIEELVLRLDELAPPESPRARRAHGRAAAAVSRSGSVRMNTPASAFPARRHRSRSSLWNTRSGSSASAIRSSYSFRRQADPLAFDPDRP
jgi:GNAT acetyltransferase-like protein